MRIIWVLTVFGIAVSYIETAKPGIQMRLTKHGMKYAIDTGISIMKEDIRKKVINKSGRKDSISWSVSGLRVTKAEFNTYQLFPVAGVGMRGKMSGVSIAASGRLKYSYKKGWFKVSDTMRFSAKTRNIHVDLTLSVELSFELTIGNYDQDFGDDWHGATRNGHPTIGLINCKAGVDSINLRFHGKLGWLYNILSGVIENKLKDALGKLLCDLAREEINTKAKSELATFPVIKKLDRHAEIDYSLTEPPSFTSNYMDAYLKGEFKPVGRPVSNSLQVPELKPSNYANKMLYLWLSDYTINTVGIVYHEAGVLKGNLEAWNSNVPEVRENLNTKKFALVALQLHKMYGESPMGLTLRSYAPPNVEIDVNGLTLNLFADINFTVKDKNGEIKNLFDAQFHLVCTAKVGSRGDNITAEIEKFDYKATIKKSHIGPILIPLDNPLFKFMLDKTVISAAKPKLARGFPLPKIDQVSFKNFRLLLKKNFIEIGTDVQYVEKA